MPETRTKLTASVSPNEAGYYITIAGKPVFKTNTVQRAETLRWMIHALYEADEIIEKKTAGKSWAVETAIQKLEEACL